MRSVMTAAVGLAAVALLLVFSLLSSVDTALPPSSVIRAQPDLEPAAAALPDYSLMMPQEEEEEDDTTTTSAPEEEGKPSSSFKNPYLPYLPRHHRSSNRSTTVRPGWRETFPPAYYKSSCAAKSSPYWRTCDAAACDRNRTARHRPLRAVAAQDADFIHQDILPRAWGEAPPHIDMYVRAGCGGADELAYLVLTLRKFYPRFLGDLIFVLDVKDKQASNFILPRKLLANYSVHVVYEHQPCLPGRLFNQYSYLNLYRHTQAEYVMTIDSDCAFHRPVTPDVLFNRRGELVLPTSSDFQFTYWHPSQYYFTKINEFSFGHSMVSQPVVFRVDTFQAFLKYITDRRHTCYESLLAQYYEEHKTRYQTFCWMCQMSSFVYKEKLAGYDVHVLHKREDEPYLRYASHVNYERSSFSSYHTSVDRSTGQGLCYWLGGGGKHAKRLLLPLCKPDMNIDYLMKLTFFYARHDLNVLISDKQRALALRQAQARLNHLF